MQVRNTESFFLQSSFGLSTAETRFQVAFSETGRMNPLAFSGDSSQNILYRKDTSAHLEGEEVDDLIPEK
jgi:hypothetical protein